MEIFFLSNGANDLIKFDLVVVFATVGINLLCASITNVQTVVVQVFYLERHYVALKWMTGDLLCV